MEKFKDYEKSVILIWTKIKYLGCGISEEGDHIYKKEDTNCLFFYHLVYFSGHYHLGWMKRGVSFLILNQTPNVKSNVIRPLGPKKKKKRRTNKTAWHVAYSTKKIKKTWDDDRPLFHYSRKMATKVHSLWYPKD